MVMGSSRNISPAVGAAVREIGESISAWRRIQRLTVEELAERAGVSSGTIRRIEHGETGVSFSAYLAVARVLTISDRVKKAFDPAETEFGQAQLVRELPKRVRK